MYLTQAKNLLAVGVLWLAVGVGCKNDEPEPVSCRDGTCCGPEGIHYKYVETYKDFPVTLTGPEGGWFLEFNKAIPTGTPDTWITAAQVCDLSIDQVINIKQLTNQKIFISCRVWGRLYIGDEMPTLTVGAPRFFAIDRIERVN